MRQKNLVKQIQNVVATKTEKTFRASTFEFLSKSPAFLSKHAVGNGKYSEYFIRISRGLYKLK